MFQVLKGFNDDDLFVVSAIIENQSQNVKQYGLETFENDTSESYIRL